MQTAIGEWWTAHKSIKTDIMCLVVESWVLERDKAATTERVKRYLKENSGYLPCSPEEFYDAYFLDFWPEF